ncbi:calcium and integrin-binding protein 1-like [Tachypleus tridentatus]|uniref:calcium and integrin-binding protein 1-like n=1 Tax=Tachypleus tridentatus TaxID=6853 RepID=UPI003FD48D8B
MGGNHSQLTEEELEDYKELTYLTRKEIFHAFKVFKNLDPEGVKKDKYTRIPTEAILSLPEFKNNPFGDRLCKVFSSQDDDKLSFEDFLDMISVLSDDAHPRKKAEYAFRVYDFDEDGYLSREDIETLVNKLTNTKMNEREINSLTDSILEVADLDKDGMLSFQEFEHVVTKSVDFKNSFHLRL